MFRSKREEGLTVVIYSVLYQVTLHTLQTKEPFILAGRLNKVMTFAPFVQRDTELNGSSISPYYHYIHQAGGKGGREKKPVAALSTKLHVIVIPDHWISLLDRYKPHTDLIAQEWKYPNCEVPTVPTTSKVSLSSHDNKTPPWEARFDNTVHTVEPAAIPPNIHRIIIVAVQQQA